MTSQDFGTLALQLLAAAQIPGNSLELAMAFKAAAQSLADGNATIEQVQPSE